MAAGVLILLVVGLFLIRKATLSDEGTSKDAMVVITTGDEVFGIYPLYEDRTVPVKTEYGSNTVVISGGSVEVSEASCRDGICVHTGKIGSPGRSIVCLPNRLSVAVVSETKEGDYDTVAY